MEATPLTITLVNRKGGVAKTGTTHQLSGAFAKMGLRVLLVDMDPQASLTKGFFGPSATEAIPERNTVLSLFDDSFDPDPEKVLRPTTCEGITILPGADRLDDFNLAKATEQGPLQTVVRSFLTEVQGQFDVTLIDCPPNLNLLSWNALLASDFVMVPMQPEDFGAQGITQVQRTIDLALAKYNPRIRMLGYLITLRDGRLALHDAYEQELRKLYGDDVFLNCFPMKNDFKLAIAERLPIHFFKPKCAAAKLLYQIAEEVLSRAVEARKRPPEFLHFENRVLLQESRKVAS